MSASNAAPPSITADQGSVAGSGVAGKTASTAEKSALATVNLNSFETDTELELCGGGNDVLAAESRRRRAERLRAVVARVDEVFPSRDA